ncbi:unknown [Prevotella sp. CAG:1124]|nr:unknown [Prevotella sp. CAG:1124]
MALCNTVSVLTYISPNRLRPVLSTKPTRLSVLAMIKGDTPRATIGTITLRSGRTYLHSIRKEARLEVRKRSTHTALHAWDMTVATAAPLTPMPNANMNRGSSAMLSTAPISTEYIATAGRPCALMNVLSPVDSSTNIVPIRYTDR